MNRAALEQMRRFLDEIVEGLDGKPFEWSEAKRIRFENLFAPLGPQLCTEDAIERVGHTLKRNATPIGRVHFGAAVFLVPGRPQTSASLYLLHEQTRPATPSTRGEPAAIGIAPPSAEARTLSLPFSSGKG